MNCPACGLDIDEHPANRCLDVWIEQAIFGQKWKRVSTVCINDNILNGNFWVGEDDDPMNPPPGYCAYPPGPPSYSTNMAAAWQIVETFRCGWRGHAAACIDIKISDWVNHPDCQVTIFAPDIVDVKAEAYSPCLAICRAALKVVNNA